MIGVLGSLSITSLADAVDDIETRLFARKLAIPVDGVQPAQLRDTYTERRGGKAHEALDIHARKGTPVVATDDGFVVKLFQSVPGGLTIYQSDPGNEVVYYYAHLDRYADDLREGLPVEAGRRHRLRRHDRQRGPRCAAPALRGPQAAARQGMVEGHADQPVAALQEQSRALTPPDRSR